MQTFVTRAYILLRLQLMSRMLIAGPKEFAKADSAFSLSFDDFEVLRWILNICGITK